MHRRLGENGDRRLGQLFLELAEFLFQCLFIDILAGDRCRHLVINFLCFVEFFLQILARNRALHAQHDHPFRESAANDEDGRAVRRELQ